jgi:hypothetical protein
MNDTNLSISKGFANLMKATVGKTEAELRSLAHNPA